MKIDVIRKNWEVNPYIIFMFVYSTISEAFISPSPLWDPICEIGRRKSQEKMTEFSCQWSGEFFRLLRNESRKFPVGTLLFFLHQEMRFQKYSVKQKVRNLTYKFCHVTSHIRQIWHCLCTSRNATLKFSAYQKVRIRWEFFNQNEKFRYGNSLKTKKLIDFYCF